MLRLQLIKYFVTLIIFTSSFSSWANVDLSRLAEGRPKNQTKGYLPVQQYTEVQTYQLANPTLVWVNWALLEEMGYDVHSGTEEERKQKVLQALGWVTKDVHLGEGIITEKTKTLYADKYGGWGIGYNHGSARAAAAGDIQIKGIGVTPLLRGQRADHTARSSTHESIKDAVWGEVLNNEIPYGANRLVAIIDRNDRLEDGESQMLEVRLDPVRMGHFIRRQATSDDEDVIRARYSSDKLLATLPQPENAKNTTEPGEKLFNGLHEFARRLGVQFSHAYMKRIFHGALSQSNIEITGRMIDFGTASANPNFGKINFLEAASEFGAESRDITRYLLTGFVKQLELNKTLQTQLFDQALKRLKMDHPTFWRSYLADSMENVFHATYQSESQKIALQLSGVPDKIIETLAKRHQELASELVLITKMENSRSTLVELKSAQTLSYQKNSSLEILFSHITQLERWSEASMVVAIKKMEQEKELDVIDIEDLAKKLLAFLQEARAEAQRLGVDGKSFKQLIRANYSFRHRAMPELFMPTLKKTTSAINREYLNGEKNIIGEKINEIVASSIRTVHGLEWYQAPLRALSHNGKIRIQVYDAKTGATSYQRYQPKDRQIELKNQDKKGMCRVLFAG